ncbi:MAG: O-antigen ligase family protein [Colwellia sp.]|jgi:O-Antigen ligase.
MKAVPLGRRAIILLLSALISLSLLTPLLDIFKYFKYIVGPLSVLLYLLGDFKLSRGETSRAEKGFVLLLVYGVWSIWLSGDRLLGVKDLYFISCYLLPIIFFIQRDTISSKDLTSIFYLFSVIFLFSIIGRDYKGFSISESKAPFEGSVSFVFGGFFLYFMMFKDKKGMILSALLMFLSLKRIALLGVFVGGAVWFIPSLWRMLSSNRIFLLLVNLGFILFLFLLVDGFFDDVLELYTGKGAQEITLGRLNHYVGVLENIGNNFLSFFLGGGAGSTYELAMQYDYFDRVGGNLHSDTLKVFYEYGFVIFCVFFGLLSAVKGKAALVMSIYMMCLFFTDNVIVYVSVMFFLLLLTKQAGIREEEKSNDLANS